MFHVLGLQSKRCDKKEKSWGGVNETDIKSQSGKIDIHLLGI